MGRAKVVVLIILGAVVLAAGYSVARRFVRPRPVEPLPAPGRVRVEVLNGTGTAGVGRACAQYLTGLGFDVRDIGTATEPFAHTLIFDRTDPRARNARALAQALHHRARPGTDLDSLLCIDATVIVGRDYLHYFRPPAHGD